MNNFFTYSLRDKYSAELISLLDSVNAPDSTFKRIINWHKRANREKVDFKSSHTSRSSCIRSMEKSLPTNEATNMLPNVRPTKLKQQNDPVDLVVFDAYTMILSLLQNKAKKRL